MPYYEYLCRECRAVTVRRKPVAEAGSDDICQHCNGRAERIYSVPLVVVYPDAVDVMNRAAAGEGDPLPGWSREKTRRAALALSQAIKEGKSFK